MQFRRVIDYLEGICILHNDPGIAQNLEITEQKSELTITNLIVERFTSIERIQSWTTQMTQSELIFNSRRGHG